MQRERRRDGHRRDCLFFVSARPITLNRRFASGKAGRRLTAGIGDATAGAAAATTLFLLESVIEDPSHIDGSDGDDQDNNQCLHRLRPLRESVAQRGPNLVDDHRQGKGQACVEYHGK